MDGQPLGSREFPESGYYLLQHGHRGSADRISVLFDCGELGYSSIAAHGHADALSVMVRAFGDDLLVDPGTFDYFTYPEWRRYFRSTSAHNTVAIDGTDQSEMRGLFLWGRRANTRRTEWLDDSVRPAVAGEHDGYSRLTDPVTHSRRLELDRPARILSIVDTITAAGAHDVCLSFHVAESCTVEQDGQVVRIRAPRGTARLVLDPALSVAVLRGSTNPPGGWVSRGYHRKLPAATVVASARLRGTTSLSSRLEIDPVA